MKDRDVGPEEIFYVGFHFMEEGEEMRPFAKALLEHLIKKYPKSKLASPARQKLDLHIAPPPPPEETKRSSSRQQAAARQAGAVVSAPAPVTAQKPGTTPARGSARKAPASPVQKPAATVARPAPARPAATGSSPKALRLPGGKPAAKPQRKPARKAKR
jgi:hypothetical protein